MRFLVSFSIPANLLTTVVGVLTDEVQDLKIEQATKPAKSPSTRAVYKPDRQAEDVILDALSNGKPHSLDALDQRLVREGFSAHTSSSTATALVRKGKIVRVSRGRYQLLPGEAQ